MPVTIDHHALSTVGAAAGGESTDGGGEYGVVVCGPAVVGGAPQFDRDAEGLLARCDTTCD